MLAPAHTLHIGSVLPIVKDRDDMGDLNFARDIHDNRLLFHEHSKCRNVSRRYELLQKRDYPLFHKESKLDTN